MKPYNHPPATRRVLESLVPVICPPEAQELADAIIDHMALTVAQMPPMLLKALSAGFHTYDLGALPRYRKRAHKIGRADATSYYESGLHGVTPLHREFAKLLNQLMSMSCYEQPAMLGRLTRYGATPSLGTDCDPYFNSSMLWVTRHAFLHQRELDNRSLWHEGAWPAKTQHSTLTRDALYWATMGGAKAFGLDRKTGSITPGKQADLVMFDTRGMNIFPALPGGNAAHIVVMYAETSDIENVLVAGRFAKRDGQLVFDAGRLQRLQQELLASRLRMFEEGGYQSRPVERGPQPKEFFL